MADGADWRHVGASAQSTNDLNYYWSGALDYLKVRALANALSVNGRVAIVNSMFRRLFSRARGTVQISDFDGDLNFNLDLGEHMQRRIFWMGYCNLDIIPLLKRLLSPGMVYADVGANVGELTLVSAKTVGVTGRAIAFEPVSATAQCLRDNLAQNDMAWVEVVEKGLSNEIGSFSIYTPQSASSLSGEVNKGLPSLFGNNQGGQEIQKVELSTLDVFFASAQRLDVLKIDIEGAELPCLKGGLQTVARLRPHIIIEVQEETTRMAGYEQGEILHLLGSLSYEFFVIGRGGKLTPVNAEGLGPSQNVLCVPLAS